MPRLASLCLPFLPTERIRRAARPERPAQEFGSAAPGGLDTSGFRPGARWARAGEAQKPFEARSEVPALATIHRSGQRLTLASLSPEALALGLAPGMALIQARILAPGLEVKEAEPEADAALLRRLADHGARWWSPRIALSPPDGLWLDLTGAAHLFGGEAAWCDRLLATCARLGLTARVAVAGSFGTAHALARFAAGPVTLCAQDGEGEALAPLPVEALRLDEPALAVARRLGLETISDLLALPRAPLQRRFGAALLDRLDAALGRAAEPIEAVTPTDPPRVRLRFLEPILTAEAIEEAAGEGLRRLALALGRRGLGARRVDCHAERIDGGLEPLSIRLSRATRDAAHLLSLLRPRIETIDPGFGIEAITFIAAWSEPLAPEPLGNGLAESEDNLDDLVPLVDRLAARLGPRRLYRPSAVESDVPERSVERVGPLARVRGWPRWPRPIRFLHPPEPVQDVIFLLPDQPPRRFSWRGTTYRVRAADGPERIHGEWWKRAAEGAAVRDYFQVEDEEGRRFWLFRRGDGMDPATGDLGWHLHGLFA